MFKLADAQKLQRAGLPMHQVVCGKCRQVGFTLSQGDVTIQGFNTNGSWTRFESKKSGAIFNATAPAFSQRRGCHVWEQVTLEQQPTLMFEALPPLAITGRWIIAGFAVPRLSTPRWLRAIIATLLV